MWRFKKGRRKKCEKFNTQCIAMMSLYMSLYVTTVQHQSHEPPCFLSCHHEPRGGFLACGNSKIKQRTITNSKQVVLRGREVDETWTKSVGSLGQKSFFLMAKSWWNWGTGSNYNTSSLRGSASLAFCRCYVPYRPATHHRHLQSAEKPFSSFPQRSPFCAGLNMAGRSQAAFG